MFRVFPRALIGILFLTGLGCGAHDTATPPTACFVRRVEWAEHGVWLKADLHVHTRFSDGAVTLEKVVDEAVAHGCDCVALTDHADTELSAASDEYFAAMSTARRKHPDTLLFAGLEWNVPPWKGREHAGVIVPPGDRERKQLRDFKTLFDDWNRETRDPEMSRHALEWLASQGDNVEGPIVVYHHPNRKRDDLNEFTAELVRWRKVNDIAIGFEGAPGHQRRATVGAYKQSIQPIDRWDPAAADIGGTWDQLLGQGFDVWGAIASSDFHQGAPPPSADDYWPGEFSETWLYAPDRSPGGVLRALRAGSFFATHGHIAREVELTLKVPGLPRAAIAGEVVYVPPGDEVSVALSLRIPEQDWQQVANRIDEIEFITIADGEAKVVATQTSEERGDRSMVRLTVPKEGVVVRARGRRRMDNAPDLMFYTNSIRIVTKLPTSRAGQQTVAVGAGISPKIGPAPGAASHPGRHAWQVLLAIFVATGLMVGFDQLLGTKPRWRRSSALLATLTPKERQTAQWILTLGMCGFLALAVYGSFVPLRWKPIEWSVFSTQFQAIWSAPITIESRTDWGTNILLFVPIGFCLLGLTLVRTSNHPWRAVAPLLVMLGCLAASVSIELAQLGFAGRTSSQNDIVAQSFGTFMGMSLWLFTGGWVAPWLVSWSGASSRSRRLDLVLELYLVCIAAYTIMPLDLTVRPAELYDKFKAGRINLIPFAEAANPAGFFGDLLKDLMLFIPLGVMAAVWRWPSATTVRSWQASLLIGLTGVCALEASQLLVQSRYSSTTDIVTGTCAIEIGWFLAWWYRKTQAAPDVSAAPAARLAALSYFAIAGLYALFLLGILCWPYEHVANGAEAQTRLRQLLTRIPFASLQEGSPLNAAWQMLRKTFLFAVLGGLLALATSVISAKRTIGRRLLIAVWLLATVYAASVELLQVMLPPHVPDLTDILLYSSGTAFGLWLFRWWASGQKGFIAIAGSGQTVGDTPAR